MIPSIDDVVGRLDAALGKGGQRERTLFVFTSDNGMLIGEHGIIRKILAYEPSIRVPLVARLPGRIPPGAQPDEAVLNVDLGATFLSVAGVAPDAGPPLDGLDAMALFDGEDPHWREDWVYVAPYRPGGRPPFLASRSARWKYVRYAGRPVEEELFDLQEDPDERHNLATNPADREALEDMRRRLRLGMRALEMPEAWWPKG
jgi:N-acetylglucosamine-6-sulfatase